MHKTLILSIAVLLLGSCVAVDMQTQRESTYAPIEQSLTNINQKVAGHLLVEGIPDGFDEARYKEIVEKVCFPKPACRTQAEGIFNAFTLKVRKIDAMFSVMLCDKGTGSKVMEDFSCNNLRVEVQSWKTDGDVRCEFEENWEELRKEYCGLL